MRRDGTGGDRECGADQQKVVQVKAFNLKCTDCDQQLLLRIV